MKRRRFLTSIGLAIAALVAYLSPRKYVLYGDGLHDDTEAFKQVFLGNGENVTDIHGNMVGNRIPFGTFNLRGALISNS